MIENIHQIQSFKEDYIQADKKMTFHSSGKQSELWN